MPPKVALSFPTEPAKHRGFVLLFIREVGHSCSASIPHSFQRKTLQVFSKGHHFSLTVLCKGMSSRFHSQQCQQSYTDYLHTCFPVSFPGCRLDVTMLIPSDISYSACLNTECVLFLKRTSCLFSVPGLVSGSGGKLELLGLVLGLVLLTLGFSSVKWG